MKKSRSKYIVTVKGSIASSLVARISEVHALALMQNRNKPSGGNTCADTGKGELGHNS
jgi:hypothetical protein